jgi:hypothetical protein
VDGGLPLSPPSAVCGRITLVSASCKAWEEHYCRRCAPPDRPYIHGFGHRFGSIKRLSSIHSFHFVSGDPVSSGDKLTFA